ncbi:hypothetical protein DYB32_001750 [Aphanomyces invadans]|nr:hypothetical protein DYB32_001750 [Aphanomyces invadans]
MIEQAYKLSKLNECVPLPVPPAKLTIKQPLDFNRKVLDEVFGPEGTAMVFQAQAKVRGHRPCHLEILPIDEDPDDACAPTTEAALDQWFDSIKG